MKLFWFWLSSCFWLALVGVIPPIVASSFPLHFLFLLGPFLFFLLPPPLSPFFYYRFGQTEKKKTLSFYKKDEEKGTLCDKGVHQMKKCIGIKYR